MKGDSFKNRNNTFLNFCFKRYIRIYMTTSIFISKVMHVDNKNDIKFM